MKKTLLLTFMFAFSTTGFAQAGSLDPAFGNNGIVNVPSEQVELAYAVAAQSDGKIVAGGINIYNICLKRYNTNGTLDTSFGNQGSVIQMIGEMEADEIDDIKIQPDGKIVVSGSCESNEQMFLARYNANGTLDTNFGSGGIIIIDISGDYSEVAEKLFLQADGKIVFVGRLHDAGTNDNYPYIAKFNSNGTPDTSFNGSGWILDYPMGWLWSAALQPDGKVILLTSYYTNGDTHPRFIRYTATGMPDTTFGEGGSAIIQTGIQDFHIRDFVVLPDGKITGGGHGVVSNSANLALLRLNDNGTPDTSFGSNGISIPVITGGWIWTESLTLQPDGKVIFCGSQTNRFAMARYNANGTIDSTFGNNGLSTVTLGDAQYYYTRGLIVLPDGKLVMAGTVAELFQNFTVMRFLGSGSTTGIEEMTMAGMVIYPNPTTNILNISNPENVTIDNLIITDITGKTVMSQTGNASQIDVQNLSPGIYFLNISSEGKEHQHKFIKQ